MKNRHALLAEMLTWRATCENNRHANVSSDEIGRNRLIGFLKGHSMKILASIDIKPY